MKLRTCTPWLAALLALGLAACSSTETNKSSESVATTSQDSAQGAINPEASSANTYGNSQSTATTSSGMSQQSTTSSPSTSGSLAANATVTNIENVSKSSSSSSSTTTGSSGTSGRTATSSERYRITLRMDDGSTRTVMQESAPSFKSGDRVAYDNGMIQQPRQ